MRLLLKHIVRLSCLVVVSATLIGLGSGEAVAAHVSCGDVVTQDTRLDSDLIDCPASGVVIGADDITLDLGGHTIDAIALSPHAAIDNSSGHDGVRILDGTVHDYAFAVRLIDAADNLVRGISANEGGAIEGHRLKRGRIESSVVSTIWLGASERTRVEQNAASSIIVDRSSDIYVMGNHVSNERFLEAIPLIWSERIVVRRNVLHETGIGIVVFGSHNSSIDQNSISASGVGVNLQYDSTHNRVERNVISESGRGIDVYGEQTGSNQNRIERNLLLRNYDGIAITASHDNLVERNAATWNTSDGIFVRASSVGNSIEDNRTKHNGDDGIDVDNAGTTLRANRANRNGDLGIEAVEGVVDGGRNRAFGNGNPLQCLYVACR